MRTASPEPRVTILLCTLNGASHLEAQLQSFLAQEHGNWALWVSDDGSSDGTLDILRSFQRANPHRLIEIVEGPRRGCAANYLSALAGPLFGDRIVAFSDQDDVWLPCRLARAVAALDGQEGAALYCSRTWEADRDLGNRRLSRRSLPKPGFPNALVQNIIAGNTIALNEHALRILRRISPPADVPFHDWWLYLVMTGIGATIHFDPVPTVVYRQHGANTIGAARGSAALAWRLWHGMRGSYGAWIESNLTALADLAALLTPENQALFRSVERGRKRNRLVRLHSLSRHRVRRQTATGTVALTLAILLGRV